MSENVDFERLLKLYSKLVSIGILSYQSNVVHMKDYLLCEVIDNHKEVPSDKVIDVLWCLVLTHSGNITSNPLIPYFLDKLTTTHFASGLSQE